MLQNLKLLLPALIPSWRFFDIIAPSPRIEFTCLKNENDSSKNWHEFRPRPAKLSIKSLFTRIFWNPYWNESLFLVSCAERLICEPTEHSHKEIFERIQADLEQDTGNTAAKPYLQFRLILISKENEGLQKHIVYTSPIEEWRNS